MAMMPLFLLTARRLLGLGCPDIAGCRNLFLSVHRLDTDVRLFALRRIDRTTSIAAGLNRRLRRLAEFNRRLVEHALVMFGMLQIAFRQHAITGRRRVTRQRQVFFRDLEGIAANADIRTVAVKGLHTGIETTPAIVTATAPAAMIAMTAVPAIAATATMVASRIVSVSHHLSCFFVACRFDKSAPIVKMAGVFSFLSSTFPVPISIRRIPYPGNLACIKLFGKKFLDNKATRNTLKVEEQGLDRKPFFFK